MMASSEFHLTPSEMRLIQSYRQLTEAVKTAFSGAIEECAEDGKSTCAKPKRPSLRLIVGSMEDEST